MGGGEFMGYLGWVLERWACFLVLKKLIILDSEKGGKYFSLVFEKGRKDCFRSEQTLLQLLLMLKFAIFLL